MIDLRESIFMTKQDSAADALNRSFLAHKESYDELMLKLKENHPDYYQFKYSQDVITLEQIRNEILDENTAAITYFQGEKDVYVCLITDDQLTFTKKTLDSDFVSSVEQFMQAVIERDDWDNEDIRAMSEILITDLTGNIPADISKLIIVPDRDISYIPFEILHDPNKKGEFLVQHFQISYANSLTLLRYQKKRESHARELLAGFAPEYRLDLVVEPDTSSDSGLAQLVRSGNYNLPSAIAEVTEIANLLKGDAFVKQEATESNFKQIAGDYRIIHLAMHSMINLQDPSFSRLLFDAVVEDSIEDNQLHAQELRKLDLNAELAVLSACNTGYGQVQKGEGILSIAHEFAYAGVPSTIMSLWEVPDKATSIIMFDFYENLKQGQSKDEALRNAKLKYLSDESISASLKHPFYWAGFIATGDMGSIKAGGWSWYTYLLIAAVILLVLGLWRRMVKT